MNIKCAYDDTFLQSLITKLINTNKKFKLNKEVDDFKISDYNTLGTAVRAARQRYDGLNMTKVQKAIYVKEGTLISYQYLALIERDEKVSPNTEVIIQLAYLYDIDQFELIRLAKKADSRLIKMMYTVQGCMELLHTLANTCADGKVDMSEWFDEQLQVLNEIGGSDE
jgi:hypothetical protein